VERGSASYAGTWAFADAHPYVHGFAIASFGALFAQVLVEIRFGLHADSSLQIPRQKKAQR